MSASAWLALTCATRRNGDEYGNEARWALHRFALLIPFLAALDAA